MPLTSKQKYDLNNSNVASQNIQLGDMLDRLTDLSSASSVTITGGMINGVKFGSETDYTYFEADGTMVLSGSAIVWDDIFFPLITAKQGQTDKPAFSASELGYLFPQSDTSAIMYIIAQFPHSMKTNSNVVPHVHWKQTQSGSVVFKIDYKWFPIGGLVPTNFETHIIDKYAVPYTSGSLHQLSYGDAISGSVISGSGLGVSSMMLIKLYRDDNTYTGDAVTYQFDIHYSKDSLGSRDPYSK